MSAISPNSRSPEIYPSAELVKHIFPSATISDIKANLPYILRAMAGKNMTDLRQLIAVLATIAVEVPPFRPIEEYGKGGGRHGEFFGRGYVQLTWKRNYALYKAFSGLDVVAKPELLLVPEVAADAMMWYWCGGSGSPDIRPYAAKGDWNNVRSIVNAGRPGRIGICWGVDVFLKAIAAGISHLGQGIDPSALGPIPGGYGIGCADSGIGAQRNFPGLNPNSPGDAIAMALNIHNKHSWREYEFQGRFNVSAFKDLLYLRAQKKFRLANFADDLNEEYKVESMLLTGGSTLELELTAYKKSPNAPDPLVFRSDTNTPLVEAGVIPPDSGDIPARIYAAARANFGRSTAAGPGNGRISCAWGLGKYIILPAGLQKLGAGPYGSNAVKGVIQAIKQGRGVQIDRSQAIPGDIWCDYLSDLHIGIVWEVDGNGAKTILSNSSSRASLKWVGSVESMERHYGNKPSLFWRVTS